MNQYDLRSSENSEQLGIIPAIKMLRHASGCFLKEAKKVCDDSVFPKYLFPEGAEKFVKLAEKDLRIPRYFAEEIVRILVQDDRGAYSRFMDRPPHPWVVPAGYTDPPVGAAELSAMLQRITKLESKATREWSYRDFLPAAFQAIMTRGEFSNYNNACADALLAAREMAEQANAYERQGKG